MKRVFTYILALLALSVACQRVDLPENQPAELPTGAVGSKATITFSTADVTGPETRGIVNAQVEVETLHLIVFDENGMLVEVCKAEEHGSSDHDDHEGGKLYSVTLTVTDEPRIIHYIANCPVDQVVYGHETSIIGNMFVDRNDSEDPQTTYEVSYWARIEVPHILVEEIDETQTDGTIKKVLSLADDIKDKFMHVPLLRNYAEITVTQDENNKKFEVLGFIVYNLLNRGTVAPYNSNTQQFQSFLDKDSKNYSYPDMLKEGYEGHALTSAKLITDFVTVKDENGNDKVKEFQLGEPFYVYERKVSVMTDEEEKWRESPPHIIIKARYNGGEPVTGDSPTYYYKMDLVYTDKTSGNEEIKYYNILRNFQYQFNITAVHDVGYKSLDEAVAGAAGNNISGSSSTSKMTNISDSEGRLWVSYTDITLVTNDAVSFMYRYMPNYYDSTEENYQKVDNTEVYFENIYDALGNPVGDVITGIEVAQNDITEGEWEGYREVTIKVNAPSDIIRQQIVYLKTNNANLNRQIRHTLRKKLTMEVECTPKVPGAILQPMQVDIKLPLGMTEDMFPLKLDMETLNRTLSPDATKNTIPVTAGTSIIDRDDRRGQQSYYYTWTISTLDAYKELPDDGNMKVVTTHWRTNMAANASTFYVANKYFNQANDSWENYKYVFSNATCSPSAVGVGSDVTISFNMDNDDNAYNSRLVTISLKGMTTSDGETEYSFYPKSRDVSISGFQTTTATDPVSFTLDADEYNIALAEGSRLTYKFGGKFVDAKSLEVVTSLAAEADVEVNFTFDIDDDAFDALKTLYHDAGDAGVPMYVTLDRMYPADGQLVYSQARAEGDRYIYRIKQAGTQTIKLATNEDVGGPCTVTLQADYFDTETVEILQSNVFATAEFREWSDSKNTAINSSNTNYVIVGQTIRYYVNVSSSSEPTSVTIDDKKATKATNINTPEGTTVWYIDWSGNTKKNHAMKVEMVVEDTTFTETVGEIKVAALTLGDAINSPKTDGTMYVMQNTSYTSTYCTSVNNNLSASTSLNYYSLFTFETSGNNRKIKSVAKGTYCTGTTNGGSISFDANGTAYTFSTSGNNGRISSGNTYIRQSNNTNVTLGNNKSSNRDWRFYPVTISLP